MIITYRCTNIYSVKTTFMMITKEKLNLEHIEFKTLVLSLGLNNILSLKIDIKLNVNNIFVDKIIK